MPTLSLLPPPVPPCRGLHARCCGCGRNSIEHVGFLEVMDSAGVTMNGMKPTEALTKLRKIAGAKSMKLPDCAAIQGPRA